MENGQTSSWGAYIQRLCTLFEVSRKELLVKNGESLKRQEEIDDLHNTSLLLAHKLIEQYEEWLQEMDEIIALLKNRKNSPKSFHNLNSILRGGINPIVSITRENLIFISNYYIGSNKY